MIIEQCTNLARRGTGRVSRLLATFICVGLWALAHGCGDADLPPGIVKKAVAFDKIPERPRAAARKAIPRVEFNEGWENIDSQGKLHSYEIRGRQASDGKIREVRVSVSGEILESE